MAPSKQRNDGVTPVFDPSADPDSASSVKGEVTISTTEESFYLSSVIAINTPSPDGEVRRLVKFRLDPIPSTKETSRPTFWQDDGESLEHALRSQLRDLSSEKEEEIFGAMVESLLEGSSEGWCIYDGRMWRLNDIEQEQDVSVHQSHPSEQGGNKKFVYGRVAF